MNTFNSLDEINQHKKKGFEEVFGSVKPKFPNKTINNDLWEQLKYRARPHEVYNLDWSNYNGLDYGNLFLPYIKTMYKGGGVWLYDGAELFKGVKKAKKKVFKFDEQKHLISIINYTYPKGVEAEYKKVTVQPASHEVLTFIEVKQNNTVDIHFKFGKRFKTHLNEAFKREGKSLQISKLESNVYKTNTKSIQSFFKQQVTHYDMMRFILDKLGVETQLNNLANYNRLFSSNVISYIENFTIAGKYKPYVFIEKSQYDVYLKTEEPKNGNKRIIPEPDEMYIWLVSKDYITYDTSYIKVQFGTTIARDLKQENITKEYIEQLILDQLKSELEQNIYSTKTINKGVRRGLGNAMLRLWILDKLEESELNKEVFKTNPSLFLSLQAADFAIGKLEAVKFKEHNWNPRLSNYAPFLEGNTLDNAFYCGLINGFIDELKAIPEMISLYAKISGSEKEYNAFINGIKKLIDEGIIKTIIEASTKEYAAAIKEGNVEKLYYNFGHDIIQIVSLLIGVFQLAKGISSFVNFTKKAITYIRRFGRDGIEKLKKLNKKQIREVFDRIETGSGGFYKYKRILSRNMLKQEEWMSCAAACVKKYADDLGVNISESEIRALAKTTESGTDGKQLYYAMNEIFEDKNIFAKSYFEDIDDLKNFDSMILDSNGESFITNIGRYPNKHTIIIDKIVGKDVYIKDPWPLEVDEAFEKGVRGIELEKVFNNSSKGVEAILDLDDFKNLWAQGGNIIFKIK